ncbi:energy-coupling factor transporter transmembrane component T [Oceanobacillus sp. FSL K6-0127]|uniref:energy-coupling factor transporter transmembrane component T family protein n=1 Tax=Oceanobacillus sp. FSL K6-0127 TaxID=2921420 RepID=UPI0030EF2066
MLLNHLNPSIKALTVCILIVHLAFVFEPMTVFLFLIWTIAATFIFGKVNWKKYVLYFLPFFIFAIGMLWTTIAFADTSEHTNKVINMLGLTLPLDSFLVALALSLRILNVAALSLMFIFTTNMVDFILSLIQQLKLPPKIAYGVLAGYRFLPMMKDEIKIIHAAHQVRGVSQGKSLKDKFSKYKRFAIPLLASAIRKAERTAVAMESKGFTGDRNRTFYRQFFVTKHDLILPGILLFGFWGAWFL